MVRFTARSASSSIETGLNAAIVYFAQNADGGGTRLELQRALVFDPQDAELGMNTYCISRDSGETHYGGVVSWQINSRKLELRLDPSAADELGVGGGFEVDLDIPEEAIVAVRHGLEQILGA